VDPVPDPLLLRKSGSAGNRTWTSGSVARTPTTKPQRRSEETFLICDLQNVAIIFANNRGEKTQKSTKRLSKAYGNSEIYAYILFIEICQPELRVNG
jgi:hypothetical protein